MRAPRPPANASASVCAHACARAFASALTFAIASPALAAPLAARGAEVKGGQVYRSLFDSGAARVAVWRWAAAGGRQGAPLLILPELGCPRRFYEHLAQRLQARGREVFLVEWRGTGDSTAPIRGGGGLEALFLGDAPTALGVVREATQAPRVVLLGHGLGGAAAVLLAAARPGEVAGVVLAQVPATYEMPNEALRRVAEAVRARAEVPVGLVPLRSWAETPPTVSTTATDLFELLLARGEAFTPARLDELRAALGQVSPELVRDVGRWMRDGDLVLPDGPRLGGAKLSQAFAALAGPLLVIGAPRDNLVHLEHALYVRRIAPKAERTEIVLQRIEGFAADAGHLALTSEAIVRELVPQVDAWLAALP